MCYFELKSPWIRLAWFAGLFFGVNLKNCNSAGSKCLMIFFCCMERSDKVLLVEQAEYFQPNGHVLNRITSVQVSDRTNADSSYTAG